MTTACLHAWKQRNDRAGRQTDRQTSTLPNVMTLRRGFRRCNRTAVGSCHLARSSRRNHMNGLHSFTLPTVERSSFPRGRGTVCMQVSTRHQPESVQEQGRWSGLGLVGCIDGPTWMSVRRTPLPSLSLAPSCGAHHDAQSLFFFFFFYFFFFRLAWPIKGN
ncbi:hypothetical protein IWZ03DRAFT_185410 [Phyllosticta citriasiana]|uniref:Uncharacterized protein n=1 Tax=Phyllosticta citriasiana TaxID=595635 RepID=A0ABR1KNC6_9PEZI